METNLLLKTAVVSVWDAEASAGEESAPAEILLVFPYRGTFVRHCGGIDVVAQPNQVLFFNPNERYRISHPVPGQHACLILAVEPALLLELAPPSLVLDTSKSAPPGEGGTPVLVIREPRLRLDARAQVLVALLRHSLREQLAEPLEAECLALTLVRRSMGERTAHTAAVANPSLVRLVDRAKLVLAGDLSRRWSLADVAGKVRCSPVYLTQVFQQVEGMPLYRYQLRLRLARALALLSEYDDLTALSLDLGFTSHSHFTAAFRETYGQTPSEFRESALNR